MIGYAGTNGQDSTVPGPPGDDGDDGWTIIANPANVILTQSLGTTSSFSTADVSFSAKKGSRTATVSNLTGISEYHFDVTKTGNSSIRVNYPKQSGSSYYTEGYFEVTVHATDPDTSGDVEFTVRVLCYANLLGTWKTTVQGDVEHSVATKTYNVYDKDGNVVTSQNIGDYIHSASINTAKLTDATTDSNGNYIKSSEIKQTADGVSSTVSSITTTYDGQTVVNSSKIVQTPDCIKTWVTNELGETGIHINGTNRDIDLIAGRVNFRNSSDTGENPYFSVDSEGKMTAKNGGTIGGFEIGDQTLGTNRDSGAVGGVYIRNDGFMRIYNVDNYTGLSVIGGFELLGRGIYAVIDNMEGTMLQRAAIFKINYDANPHNQVIIGGTNTDSVNINGNAANFGSSTPVNIGSTLAVAGVASLAKNIISGSGTKTLPQTPKIGEFYFCKGTIGDMTIQVKSGTSHKIQMSSSGSESTSISINRDAHILVYMETNKWVDFKCN